MLCPSSQRCQGSWELGAHGARFGITVPRNNGARFSFAYPIGLGGGLNTYSYAGGDPVNRVDPLGLAPGDCYRTIDGAAADAVSDANHLTRRDGNEWGGLIRKLPGGGYTYAAPRTSGRKFFTEIGEMDSSTVGDYHSHGPYEVYEDGRPVNPEMFSDYDFDTAVTAANYAAHHGNPYFSYLGTPSGVISKFDPSNGNIRNAAYPSRAHRCKCGG